MEACTTSYSVRGGREDWPSSEIAHRGCKPQGCREEIQGGSAGYVHCAGWSAVRWDSLHGHTPAPAKVPAALAVTLQCLLVKLPEFFGIGKNMGEALPLLQRRVAMGRSHLARASSSVHNPQCIEGFSAKLAGQRSVAEPAEP